MKLRTGQENPSAAEQATLNSMSSLSLINMTNNDNFENTRDEISQTATGQPRGDKRLAGPNVQSKQPMAKCFPGDLDIRAKQATKT